MLSTFTRGFQLPNVGSESCRGPAAQQVRFPSDQQMATQTWTILDLWSTAKDRKSAGPSARWTISRFGKLRNLVKENMDWDRNTQFSQWPFPNMYRLQVLHCTSLELFSHPGTKQGSASAFCELCEMHSSLVKEDSAKNKRHGGQHFTKASVCYLSILKGLFTLQGAVKWARFQLPICLCTLLLRTNG